MKSKLGGSKQLKPSMPSKNAKADDPMASRGLVRRAAPQSKMPEKKGDKPMIDDITEPLDEALADVETKLADNPNDPELHKLKIKILRKMQNRPELRKALSEAANVCKTPFFAVKLAEQLEEDGAYADALEWRQWVAEIHPEDPDTVRRLAATAVRAGELEIAEKTYNRLIKLRSDDELPLGGTFYEEMLGRGLPPEKRKELQKMGLRLLARALIHRETNASILEAAARIAYRTKSYTESRGAYEQAIRSNPNHKNVHQWKAELLNVYSQLGLQENWRKLNQSLIADLSEVVKVDHTDMRAWNMLAKQQIQAGLFDDAIITLKGALRADSKNAQALWQLGRLYVRRGDSQSAIDFYRDIIDDPTEKKTIRRAIERALAELYFKLGHYDEALQIYMREVENNARMIAPILEATGNMEEAEELYLKSVVQNPRDAKSHLGLAEYWVRRGNWEKAKEAALCRPWKKSPPLIRIPSTALSAKSNCSCCRDKTTKPAVWLPTSANRPNTRPAAPLPPPPCGVCWATPAVCCMTATALTTPTRRRSIMTRWTPRLSAVWAFWPSATKSTVWRSITMNALSSTIL